MCTKKAMVVVDFMAFVRKVPVKKPKLKTYGGMAKHLWNTFTKLESNYARIDYFRFIHNLKYQGNRTEQKKLRGRY